MAVPSGPSAALNNVLQSIAHGHADPSTDAATVGPLANSFNVSHSDAFIVIAGHAGDGFASLLSLGAAAAPRGAYAPLTIRYTTVPLTSGQSADRTPSTRRRAHVWHVVVPSSAADLRALAQQVAHLMHGCMLSDAVVGGAASLRADGAPTPAILVRALRSSAVWLAVDASRPWDALRQLDAATDFATAVAAALQAPLPEADRATLRQLQRLRVQAGGAPGLLATSLGAQDTWLECLREAAAGAGLAGLFEGETGDSSSASAMRAAHGAPAPGSVAATPAKQRRGSGTGASALDTAPATATAAATAAPGTLQRSQARARKREAASRIAQTAAGTLLSRLPSMEEAATALPPLRRGELSLSVGLPALLLVTRSERLCDAAAAAGSGGSTSSGGAVAVGSTSAAGSAVSLLHMLSGTSTHASVADVAAALTAAAAGVRGPAGAVASAGNGGDSSSSSSSSSSAALSVGELLALATAADADEHPLVAAIAADPAVRAALRDAAAPSSATGDSDGHGHGGRDAVVSSLAKALAATLSAAAGAAAAAAAATADGLTASASGASSVTGAGPLDGLVATSGGDGGGAAGAGGGSGSSSSAAGGLMSLARLDSLRSAGDGAAGTGAAAADAGAARAALAAARHLVSADVSGAYDASWHDASKSSGAAAVATSPSQTHPLTAFASAAGWAALQKLLPLPSGLAAALLASALRLHALKLGAAVACVPSAPLLSAVAASAREQGVAAAAGAPPSPLARLWAYTSAVLLASPETALLRACLPLAGSGSSGAGYGGDVDADADADADIDMNGGGSSSSSGGGSVDTGAALSSFAARCVRGVAVPPACGAAEASPLPRLFLPAGVDSLLSVEDALRRELDVEAAVARSSGSSSSSGAHESSLESLLRSLLRQGGDDGASSSSSASSSASLSDGDSISNVSALMERALSSTKAMASALGDPRPSFAPAPAPASSATATSTGGFSELSAFPGIVSRPLVAPGMPAAASAALVAALAPLHGSALGAAAVAATLTEAADSIGTPASAASGSSSASGVPSWDSFLAAAHAAQIQEDSAHAAAVGGIAAGDAAIGRAAGSGGTPVAISRAVTAPADALLHQLDRPGSGSIAGGGGSAGLGLGGLASSAGSGGGSGQAGVSASLGSAADGASGSGSLGGAASGPAGSVSASGAGGGLASSTSAGGTGGDQKRDTRAFFAALRNKK